MGIKTNRVISALKASPYSKETLKRRKEGKYSTATGVAISATQNSSRILGTGLGAYTLARLGIKLLNPDTNSNSFLSSWKGLVTLALSSIAPFVADALIPIKTEPAHPQEVKPPEQTDTDTAVQEPEKVLLHELFNKLSKIYLSDLLNVLESDSPENQEICGLQHVRLEADPHEECIIIVYPALDKNNVKDCGVKITRGELSLALGNSDHQIPQIQFVRRGNPLSISSMDNVSARPYLISQDLISKAA